MVDGGRFAESSIASGKSHIKRLRKGQLRGPFLPVLYVSFTVVLGRRSVSLTGIN